MSVVRNESLEATFCGGAEVGRDGLLQPGFGSALTSDAVACISRPAPPPVTSGRAHERRWMLRFERARRLRQELQAEMQQVLASLVWLSWMLVRYGRCDRFVRPDMERALIEPAAVFAAPEDVVAHPGLSAAEKREILSRWAWDEHLQQLATDEAMPEGRTPSRLDQVRRALCALELSETAPALLFVSGFGRPGAAAR